MALAILLFVAPSLLAVPVEQTIPITFKTRLAPGKHYFTFRLYTEASGGSPVWEEAPATKIRVGGNHLSKHLLGGTTPFSTGTAGPVDFTQQLWVEPSKGTRIFTRFKLPISVYSLATAGLRVVPNANNSPNLIGGHPKNTFTPGVVGAVIGGGGEESPDNFNNEAQGDFSFIGSGLSNRVGPYGVVGGGAENQQDPNSYFQIIAGGERNATGADYAAVFGGDSNEASGEFSAILGGSGGSATGSHSVVVGGCSNTASGYGSFAAGEDARAGRSGMFVWSASDDSLDGILEEDNTFPSTTINGNPNPYLADMQFWAKAPGGFFLVTGEDGTGNPLGVTLPAGSQEWEPITPPVSDINLKRDFASTDGRAVLEKLAAIPVSTWSYRSDRAGARHIGPMAQDFSAAFGVGRDDRHIDPIDSAGVSLAAIQGLYALVRELQKRVDAQERELAAERAGSTAMRARLDELASRYAELRLLIAGAPARDGSLALK